MGRRQHMGNTEHDLTRPPDLRHTALTGPDRERRPLYVDLLPPCNDACPAGENIQAWLASAQAGDYEAAWQILVARQPAARGARPGLLPPLRGPL